MGSKARWMILAALVLAACDGPAPVGGDAGMDAGGAEEGDSGAPPPPDGGGTTEVPGECTEVCAADDDCADELGCVDGRCRCVSDARCRVRDLWTAGCTSDGDCFGTNRCVLWDGDTYCVPDDTARFNCGIGAPESKVEVMLADGSGTIQTCVNTNLVCREDGTCGAASAGCDDDGDCAFPPFNTPRCDVATGRCVCVEEPEDSCTAAHPAMQCKADGTCGCLEDGICPDATGGRCDVATGECGCMLDGDCPPGEICHEGRCRCTVANGCGAFVSPTNPGTTLERVPL